MPSHLLRERIKRAPPSNHRVIEPSAVIVLLYATFFRFAGFAGRNFQCYKELSFPVKLALYLSLLVGVFIEDFTFKVRNYERIIAILHLGLLY
ncbi:hypothetical protein HDE70_005514 [Pedobacter cryoconitis]|nr:hypothetical protein [Pedobacter cryoconitis]